MARRLVGDGQEVYRVEIVRKQWDEPLGGWGDVEYVAHYGPYNSLGVARSQLTRRTGDGGGFCFSVVSGKIQKATTTWEDVT